MDSSSIIGLINNAALLLALCLLYDSLGVQIQNEKQNFHQVLTGFILSVIGIAIMLTPWDFGQGVLFDTRSVLLSISGLFFGAIPVILVMLITSAFRLLSGGSGAWVGVAVIVTSGGIGLACRYLCHKSKGYLSIGKLYLLGIITHFVMLAWMFLLPRETAISVLSKITLPVILIYPLVTVILGKLIINRDKHKNSEEALRKNEEKFRNIFQYHSAVKLLIDPDTGSILQANEAAGKFYGWSPSELKKMRIQDINTLLPEQIKKEMEKARSLNRTYFEFRHRLAGGSIRDVDVFSSRVEVDGKELLHSIIHDVTERKKAEESLREREAFQTAMISASPMAIISYSPDGHVKTWNKAAESIFGWREEEVLGKFVPYMPKNQHREFSKFLESIVEGNMLSQVEVTRQHKNGSLIDVSISTAPIHDKESSLTAIMSVIEDVTQRKRAEAALVKSKERLNFALHMSKTGGWEMDLEDHTVYRTLEYDRIFGYESLLPSWTSKMFMDHVFPEDRLKVRNSFEKAITTKTDWTFECRIQRMDGEIRWIWAAGCHIPDHKSQMKRMAGIVQDITDRKKAEEEKDKLNAQLIQAKKMESVGRLAGGVAHDFNNMLGVILGYTELALEDPTLGDGLRADLEEIRASATRSADITRQLLAFSRQQTISPKQLDLNETVESMLKMLRRLIGEDIDLSWHPGLNLWPILMDPTQLDQVLVNLCVNARDAITNVGRISIETDIKTFDKSYCKDHAGFVPGDFVLLSISDDGCGMDKTIQERIFEPFFTTKEMGQGTGLGLATVYGIIKQNNGFINLYSEPNQGTIFRLYLPRYEEALIDQAKEKKVEMVDERGDETILLVEDEEKILKMVTMMLERLGYKVLTANTPGDAIKLAIDHVGEIRLLMTDVVMPGMNGRELSEEIQTVSPEIRVLFMSGYTANVIANRGVLYDGVNFIQKPFSKKDLATKIREALDKTKKCTQ
jgi:PAS domain S-box-containing protein